jgi:uncharacterized membrane protein
VVDRAAPDDGQAAVRDAAGRTPGLGGRVVVYPAAVEGEAAAADRRVRYPHVVEAAARSRCATTPDLHYRFGVDLFIAGVQAVARGADGLQDPVSPA